MRPRDYVIQGRTVSMPCEVRDARSSTATWLVPKAAAQALLPGQDLEVAEVMPGRALFSLSCIDYRDNDLGDYEEVSLALYVRERNAPKGLPFLGPALAMMRGLLPTYILYLPVNQSFTCDAGRQIWGFPKTVDTITFDADGDRCHCVWSRERQEILRVSMPIGGRRDFPEQTLTTYSYIDGALHVTEFSSSAEKLGVKRGGVDLELGAHPIADELRSLGLPKPALMSLWMGKMRGRFEAARRVGG